MEVYLSHMNEIIGNEIALGRMFMNAFKLADHNCLSLEFHNSQKIVVSFRCTTMKKIFSLKTHRN